MNSQTSLYYGATLSPRELGTTSHKSHFTAELILFLRGYTVYWIWVQNIQMDLTSSSWSVWLHVLLHFYLTAKFLLWCGFTKMLMLEEKAGRVWQQIGDKTIKCFFFSRWSAQRGAAAWEFPQPSSKTSSSQTQWPHWVSVHPSTWNGGLFILMINSFYAI